MPALGLDAGELVAPLPILPPQPHPNPDHGLALERVTPREAAYAGRRFGIDEPYWATLSGWGDLIPVRAFTGLPFPLGIYDPIAQTFTAIPLD